MVTQSGNIMDFVSAREVESNVLCLKTDKKKEREYKAVIQVTPVNFSLMSDTEKEGILEGFRVFLSSLSYPTMIHIRIESYDLDPYLKQMDIASQSPSESIQQMAADHRDFVLKLASTRALLQRKFYIVVPADKDLAKKQKKQENIFDAARSQLDLRCTDITSNVERMGLTARRLDNKELVHYYHSCLHVTNAEEFPVPESNIVSATQSIPHGLFHRKRGTAPLTEEAIEALETKDLKEPEKLTTPKEIEYPDQIKIAELIAPSALRIKPNYVIVRSNVDEYLRSFAIVGYPSQVYAGWLDRLIQIDEPNIEVAIHINPLDPATYTSRLTRKLTGLRATQMLEERHGRTPDPYIAAARKEVENLRDSLVSQEEQVFGVSIYIMCRSNSLLQLTERSNKLLSLLKGLEITPVELTLEHHRAWQCFLPDGRDLLKRQKILDTSSLITAFPFASSSLSTPTGILTGVMPNGSLVIIDPTSDMLENGHEVKFARSGAGKSYDEKVRIVRSLLAGFEAIVIDPEDEYLALCKRMQGINVRLSSGALQLNPFDLPTSNDRTDRNILEEKFQSLHTLFDLLLADRPGTLNQREKAFLNKCFYKVYSDKGITLDPETHHNRPPTMSDLYNLIRNNECGPDVFEIGDRLQRHVPAFPYETSIELDNPLVVFNIRDLDTDLRPVGLLLITDFVWTQVRRKRRPNPRLLVIDEAWALLQFDEGGKFLAGISRRARKYNLCVRTITQDVDDFLTSEWGRTILVNSSMKFLMKQDTSTIDSVTKAFRLSDGERKYLLSCNKGEGLFFARGSHVAMKVVASPIEHRLATTNPKELLEEEMAAAEVARAKAAETATALAIRSDPNHYDVVMPSFWEKKQNAIKDTLD